MFKNLYNIFHTYIDTFLFLNMKIKAISLVPHTQQNTCQWCYPPGVVVVRGGAFVGCEGPFVSPVGFVGPVGVVDPVGYIGGVVEGEVGTGPQ